MKLKDILNEGGGFSAKLSKEQWEVIAYSLALLESDLPTPQARKDAQRVLGILQQKGVWGNLEDD